MNIKPEVLIENNNKFKTSVQIIITKLYMPVKLRINISCGSYIKPYYVLTLRTRLITLKGFIQDKFE